MGRVSCTGFTFSLLLSTGFLVTLGCMSTQEGSTLRDDLFRAQKRILTLERGVEKSGEESRSLGNSTKRNLADSDGRISNLDRELRTLNGEVGRLRMGVITGELPGMDGQTDSIAKAMGRLEDRISQLEETQLVLLSLLLGRRGGGGACCADEALPDCVMCLAVLLSRVAAALLLPCSKHSRW